MRNSEVPPLPVPPRLHEGAVLLAGIVIGGGVTILGSEAEALRFLLQPLESGGYALRPGRKVARFQVSGLEFLSAVLPPAPRLVLEET